MPDGKIDKKALFKELDDKGLDLVNAMVRSGTYGPSIRPYVNEWRRKRTGQGWTIALSVAALVISLASLIVAVCAWLFPWAPI